MKTKIAISVFLLCLSLKGFSTVWTVNNSGTTFSPSTLTITLGDEVLFSLANTHDAIEVSKATWDANGNTVLSGGFATDFGGGQVTASQLTVGTHYYVCSPHASLGMKGQIIVRAVTGINEIHPQSDIEIYPNPTSDFLSVKIGANSLGITFSLSDQNGRKISDGVLSKELTVLNMQDFPIGIYVIQIFGMRKESFKIVKK